MESMEVKLFKRIPLFSELNEEQLKELAALSLLRKYSKGEVIFNPAQKAESFFILKRGKVKVYKTSKGKEQIIRIFTPPVIFGEAASFTGENFPAWAEAVEESEVVLIPRNGMIKLLKEDPELGMKLLSVMAQRLVYLTNVIESLSLKSALSKVASYILQKSLEVKDTEKVPFSTSTAAMELGLTKETVSRTLAKLKQLNVIKKEKGYLQILNVNALKELAS
jgi:CRP/FNR family transcriptional regulator